MQREIRIVHHITPPFPRPPLRDIVVPPEKGVDNGDEVEDEEGRAEDGTREFAVAPEEPGGDPGYEEGEETEEDPEEEVDLEGGGGVGGWGTLAVGGGGREAEGGQFVGVCCCVGGHDDRPGCGVGQGRGEVGET